MSHQSTHHHHSLPNSIPPTHHHHQPNHTVPIKPENNSDDDEVVFLSSVPKVPHTPENYDPECQCSTCQLATKLLAECTCEECRGTGQPDQSSENVPIANAVSPTNGQPSSSSIQNNDAFTSEHTNANDQHDDPENSITPDLPRLFDDESGDLSSDDSEDDDDSVDKNDSSHNESANSDDERPDLTPVKCPKCPQTFLKIHRLLRHYTWVHQEWKPYYCLWPKCNYTSAVDHLVITHANRSHFKSENRQTAKKYVAKREGTPPKDSVLEQIVAMKFDSEKKSSCPQCGRNLSLWGMKNHIRSHANSGYRCTWPNCGFFYSLRKQARKHLCFDHLRAEKASLLQTKRYLVKVDPNLPNSNGLHDTIQNNDASTSEHTNSNDQHDDHSRSSTPDYLPRFFDDESGDSSSDDCEDDSVDDDEDDEDYKELDQESDCDRNNDKSEAFYSKQVNSFGCPKCESSFKEKGKLLRHYRGVHQELKPYYCKWPKCEFEGSVYDNVVHHVYRKHFNMKNREKAKRYVVKGEKPSSLQEDPIYESILGFNSFNSNCPKCGRNFTHRGHFKRHIRSHKKSGYRCTWLQCGFFFSDIKLTRKHILKQHLKGKLVNSTQINEHLIKVDLKLSNYHEHQNNDASTSEHINGNDQDDDRKRNATPDYLPRFFDDESGDSSSDDCESDDSFDDENENNDNGSKSSANSSAPVHTSSKLSSSKCLKRSFDESQFNKHTKTNDSKRKHHKCPQCRRILPSEHFEDHIRTHSYSGFRCNWPNCGFFYARLQSAKKHVCVDHLQVDTANSQLTNRYLVKVDPKTGETTKIRIHIRLERGPAQHMNGDDQVDDDRSRSSTPDYRPRSFDVESGDLSSDDSDDDDYKEHDHENESDDDGDESDAFSKPSTSKRFNESNSKGSNIGPSPIKCPKCERTFTHRSVLLLHYRGVHQEWKPYYCRWPKCNFTSAVDHLVITHTNRVHFNSQNRQIAKTYVGKRKEAPPKDRLLEQIVKFDLKSKHINVNDDHSRSSTPDYQPRFFDDESGDSSSDDCEDDDDYKELDQKSESDEDDDNDSTDADYVFSKPSTSKSHKISHTQISRKHIKTIHVDTKHKCRLCNRYFSRKQSLTRHHRVIHQKLKPYYCKWPKCNFVTGRQDGLVEHITLTHFNHIKNVQKANLYVGRFKLRKNGIDKTGCSHKSAQKKHNDKLSKGSKTNQVKAFVCPKCESSFDERGYLLRHYRRVHHEWKPYYCKWPKCEFVAGVHDSVVLHANQKHFNSQNRKKARIYVGMRKMFSSPPKDPIYESLLRGTSFSPNRRVKSNYK